MTQLAKYEAARRALAEAHRIDEVKDIRDKAAAMQTYAMQAKDRELIEMATDIKLRAERRAGELLREMPKNKGTQGQAKGKIPLGAQAPHAPKDHTPTLADLGLTDYESQRWQKLAKMPEKEFEEKLTGVKTVMRAKTEGQRPKPSKPKPLSYPESERKVRNAKIVKLHDQGMTPRAIAAEVGIVGRAVHQILEHERIRRAAHEEPDIDRALLSMSAQEKLDAAIRQHKHSLDLQFERRVLDEIKKRIDEMILPHWKKQIDQAQELYARRRGLMNKETFNKIRRGLHPDSRNSISDKVLGEAFDTFMGLEKFLLSEKDSPTEVGAGLPNSWAEWEAAKQKATAARRAKRNTNPLRRQ